MLSRIVPQDHELVQAAKRRYLTKAQKVARWTALGSRCTMCGMPCEPYGPTVIWDHPKGVWFGEETDPNTMEPHHKTPECAGAKTAADATRRAKTKRLIKKLAEERKPSRLKSRGFDKSRSRKMDGTVVVRGVCS